MVLTRAKAAKAAEIEEQTRHAQQAAPAIRTEGTWIDVTPSDTGLGTHMRWRRQHSEQLASSPSLGSVQSFDSRSATPATRYETPLPDCDEKVYSEEVLNAPRKRVLARSPRAIGNNGLWHIPEEPQRLFVADGETLADAFRRHAEESRGMRFTEKSREDDALEAFSPGLFQDRLNRLAEAGSNDTMIPGRVSNELQRSDTLLVDAYGRYLASPIQLRAGPVGHVRRLGPEGTHLLDNHGDYIMQ